MTDKGIIIARPVEGISLNGLEYLFKDDRNEIRHFDSLEEANKFLTERSIDDEDIILKYHIFCQQCAKEFFFQTDEMPEEAETAFYVCPDCKQIIEEKQNANILKTNNDGNKNNLHHRPD